nr:helix-turn-helix domain-containing protein [Candidatus Njordarchaeum guaymaensis]
MRRTKNSLQQAEILNKELGLSPYESRTFLSLLTLGPMSPSEIAQRADIPRPRIYDVLRSLVQKGLLMEQSGKPAIYAPVDPSEALRNLLTELEHETSRQLEERREIVRTLSTQLSQMYKETKHLKLEESKVWFTERDTTFISMYIEAIRNCDKEVLIASTSPTPPEKEILEAVRHALKKGKSVRVVRQITEGWTLKDLEDYERYIKAGSQVRYLDIKEIPLRFMIFDDRDVILVFPSEKGSTALEALWLRIPPLARILHQQFEELWKKGTPILPVLNEIKQKKRASEEPKKRQREA